MNNPHHGNSHPDYRGTYLTLDRYSTMEASDNNVIGCQVRTLLSSLKVILSPKEPLRSSFFHLPPLTMPVLKYESTPQPKHSFSKNSKVACDETQRRRRHLKMQRGIASCPCN